MMDMYDYVDGCDEWEIYEQSGCDALSNLYDDWKEDELYFWKTKDGKFIPVNELTDDHIVNIVMLFGKQSLERNGHKMIVEKFNKIRKERGF